MTQFPEQFKSRVIFTFAVPGLLVLSVIFYLNLSDLESVMFSFGSSLQYCHKPADVFA